MSNITSYSLSTPSISTYSPSYTPPLVVASSLVIASPLVYTLNKDISGHGIWPLISTTSIYLLILIVRARATRRKCCPFRHISRDRVLIYPFLTGLARFCAHFERWNKGAWWSKGIFIMWCKSRITPEITLIFLCHRLR